MDPDNDPIVFYEKSFKLRPSIMSRQPDRMAQPRMSLLGKPFNYYRGNYRDARYRRLQSRIYNFLERTRGLPAIVYHVAVFLVILACLVLSIFSTIEEYETETLYILFRMEIFVVIWLATEFFLRVWSSGCRSRYQGLFGRLKFLKRPFCIIDIVTIVAFIVVLGIGSSGQVFATNTLRGLRIFQLIRMVRMDRRGGTWKLLGSVVYAHSKELITTLYIGFLGLIFASFLVYLIEKDVNEKFSNYAQALWWGLITLSTVGYGDAVPETWQGKLLTSFCALLGISFFALPAGILGSGFALKVQQQQRQKHMTRRRQPAAYLIQAVWRCYAADEHSISLATWKIYQVALPTRSYPASPSSNFKNHISFVGRLPAIKRYKPQSTQSPGGDRSKTFVSNRVSTYTRIIRESNQGYKFDEDYELRGTQLTNQHKNAIRFLRKLKYFAARRIFKEALKPYDVKDVMEQYAAGHVDLLARVKYVHARLDLILGKQGSNSNDASKISLASRVIKVERQVVDIEVKLDILIKAYMEDRERFQAFPLTQKKENRIKRSVTLRSTSQPCEKENLVNEIAISKPIPKIEVEAQSVGSSPRIRPESSVIIIDEYADLEEEEEEDLNCEEEFDQYPSWASDGEIDTNDDGNCDETTEDTTLLQRPTRSEIVIAPISPVSSAQNLPSMDDQNAATINK